MKHALHGARNAEKKALAHMVKRRESFVKWSKAHKASLTAEQKVALRHIRARKAAAKAKAAHAASVARHQAAIRVKAAAYRAAVKAHIKVQKHARKMIKLVL